MIAYCSLLVNGPPASENEKRTLELIEGSCSRVDRETWPTVGHIGTRAVSKEVMDSSPLPKGAN